MKVESTIEVYEINGATPPPAEERKKIKVHSHWNHTDRVVLEIDGQKYTVIAADINMAVTNAQNHRS